MPIRPEKFHAKPVEFEAMRWDGTAEGATPIIEWALSAGATAKYICSDVDRCAKNDGDAPHWIKVTDSKGEFFVHIGEWLVRDDQGWFDRQSHVAFEAAYERVATASRPYPSSTSEEDER